LKAAFLTSRNVFYLNIAIAIILTFSTLFFVRDMISRYFEKQKTPGKNISSAPAGIPVQQQRPQFTDYALILKNNPFGFQGGELRPLSASAGTKGQPAGLALIGTVAGPRELSYAIFRDNSGTQEVFKVGEPVYGLGVLSMVKKDRVLLKKGGSVTEIPLEDVQVKEIRNPASAGSPGSQFARRIGSGSYVVDQGRLQQAIANPGQMMTDARLRPNVTDGKQDGFVLSEVKPGGIYQSLGLQDGDVLLRINDYDISNPERALQAFTALRGLDRVQIDLIRSGSKMTMTYQIK
jgi:general secretion pathway protein C